jgi:hypothetical protein
MNITEKDQINGLLSLFILESPEIEDEEKDAISIEASGHEAIKGVKMTINIDSFSL